MVRGVSQSDSVMLRRNKGYFQHELICSDWQPLPHVMMRRLLAVARDWMAVLSVFAGKSEPLVGFQQHCADGTPLGLRRRPSISFWAGSMKKSKGNWRSPLTCGRWLASAGRLLRSLWQPYCLDCSMRHCWRFVRDSQCLKTWRRQTWRLAC
jgi:hypothetical protein